MAVNYTNLLSLGQPVTGTEAGTWGDDVNNAVTAYLDIAIAGTLTLSTDTDVTLAKTQGTSSGTNINSTTSQYSTIRCTGARTAIRNISVPNTSKSYIILNETSGGFAVRIRGVTGPTAGVTVPNGRYAIVAWAGTDFVIVATNDLSIMSGALPNSSLANSAITINETSVSLGGSITVSGGGITTGVSQSATGTSLSWAPLPLTLNRITIILRGVSTNGTSNWLVRLRGAGSYVNGGYTSSSTYSSTSSIPSSSTAGFLLAYGSYSSSAATIDGHVVITRIAANAWVASHCLGSNSNGASLFGGGAIDLGSEQPLDGVRLTTVNGTDTFDAGEVNIFYE